MSLLRVSELSVQFGRTLAVRNVSLEVEAGHTTGVLGANGAGKTSTLLGILNRVPRASGRIEFEGVDVTALNTVQLVRAGIALCPENRRLFPNMTIEDNLRLGAYGRGSKVERQRLDEAYERFPMLKERHGELAGRLSGGQQEIVAIARSLMSHPKLLLLDEPSSGLSPVAIDEVREVLKSVADTGTAVLLVEQNVKLVQALCDTAWVLGHGQVTDHGPVDELLGGVRVADAYLGGLALTEGAPIAEPIGNDPSP